MCVVIFITAGGTAQLFLGALLRFFRCDSCLLFPNFPHPLSSQHVHGEVVISWQATGCTESSLLVSLHFSFKTFYGKVM